MDVKLRMIGRELTGALDLPPRETIGNIAFLGLRRPQTYAIVVGSVPTNPDAYPRFDRWAPKLNSGFMQDTCFGRWPWSPFGYLNSSIHTPKRRRTGRALSNRCHEISQRI